jgi:hypothetical protein
VATIQAAPVLLPPLEVPVELPPVEVGAAPVEVAGPVVVPLVPELVAGPVVEPAELPVLVAPVLEPAAEPVELELAVEDPVLLLLLPPELPQAEIERAITTAPRLS